MLNRCLFVCNAVCLLFICHGSFAAPFRPAGDGDIIEHMPRPVFGSVAALRAQRAALMRAPQNIRFATKTAQNYILQARASGEPRFLAYAQAALNPWWTQKTAPDDVLVLRAIIEQANHRFEAALADLDTVIQRDPRQLQARLTRASIYQVQARYGDARRDCAHLLLSGQAAIGTYCLATISHLSGQTRVNYNALLRFAEQSMLATEQRRATFTLLGEMAARLGDNGAAEQHFLRALIGGRDAYLESAYADFLLERGRAKDVLALLGTGPHADGALLRRALAQKMLGDRGLGTSLTELRSRFAAADLRGDTLHQRERARFALHLDSNPQVALEYAQRNWRTQREPADARILLEAALAAREPASAKLVAQWLIASRNDEPSLRVLARRIVAAKS